MIAAHENLTALRVASPCGQHVGRTTGIRTELAANRDAHRQSEHRQSRRRQHLELVEHSRVVMHRIGSLERHEGDFRKSKHRSAELFCHLYTHLYGLFRFHRPGEYYRFGFRHDASADGFIVSVANFSRERWQQHPDMVVYQCNFVYCFRRLQRPGGAFRNREQRRLERQHYLHAQLHGCRRHHAAQRDGNGHERHSGADSFVVGVAHFRRQRW